MGYVKFTDPQTGEVWRSDTDLHLIREKMSVGSPRVRRRSIPVPGMDGTLDASGWCGRTLFEDRPVTISLGKTIVDRYAQDSLVKNALHGRTLRITDSDDPDYYWLGRVEVGEWVVTTGIGKLTIQATCDPYKYRQQPTTVRETVPRSGTMTMALTCERMPTVPTITATADATLTWQGRSLAISAGQSYRDLSLELRPGVNQLGVQAARGTVVTVVYQEGSL